MNARAATVIRQLPRLLDVYHERGGEKLSAVASAIARMRAAEARAQDPSARSAISRTRRRHEQKYAALVASRRGIEQKKAEYATNIARLRTAEAELQGLDSGLGILPLVIAGAVSGLAAFGSWIYSNIKASDVAQQQAENDAEKIDLIEQGKLPPSALTTPSSGPEGLGNVLKWGAVLVGVVLAFSVIKEVKGAFSK